MVLTTYDIKRLDLYSRNMVDYHLVTDLLPAGKELRTNLFTRDSKACRSLKSS